MARQVGSSGVIQIATVGVGRLNDWSIDWTVDEIEATEMGSEVKEVEAGHRDATMRVSGNFDSADAGQEDVWDAINGPTKVGISIYPTGSTVAGQLVYSGTSMLVSGLSVSSTSTGLVTFSFNARGAVTRGLVGS